MNNILSIFQICIYCQLGVVCQNIDCLFYGAGTETIVIENDSDDDDDQNIARSFQLAVEITDKLGISPGGRLFSVYKHLLQHNKKTSRTILCLSAIYYVANLQFYFPIYNLLRYCENAETTCTLHQKFVKIWIKSNLDPPPDNPRYVIEFISARDRRAFPPKYSNHITQIMHTIKDGLCKMKVSNMKLPVLVTLSYYFYDQTSSESDNLCALLRISKSVVNRNKSFVMQSDEIVCNLRSLKICIDL